MSFLLDFSTAHTYGNIIELDLRYTYDSKNRLLTVSAADGSQFVAYKYNANGLRITQGFANGAETIYTYNKDGLLTELINRNGEDILSSFSYTYALDGNQLSRTNADGDVTEYVYDRLGRLVDETAPDYAISYAYDDWSNRLSLNYQSPNASECYAVDYEYDENNRLLVETKTIDNEVETSTYYYDANGNLVEKINNAEGVLVSERRSYNGFGYLVCFQKGEKEVWYRYRPDGLRHSKQIIEDSENRVTTHFWDGQNIVLESSTNGSTKAKYIRGLALIAQGIDSSMFYYLHNGHGDVVQRIDNYGNPLVSYEYDAFGNQLNQCETDPNPFRYCGEYFDEETGEIYLRFRNYNPNTGRFTSEDPIGARLNWYAYCGNDPIKHQDQYGLDFYIYYHEGPGRETAAKAMETHLEEVYGIQVHTILADTPDAFISNWNNMGNTSKTIGGEEVQTSRIEGVITIMHGNETSIHSGDGANMQLIDTSLLANPRAIDLLFLASCNTGGKALGKNIAQSMAEFENINFVIAPTKLHASGPTGYILNGEIDDYNNKWVFPLSGSYNVYSPNGNANVPSPYFDNVTDLFEAAEAAADGLRWTNIGTRPPSQSELRRIAYQAYTPTKVGMYAGRGRTAFIN